VKYSFDLIQSISSTIKTFELVINRLISLLLLAVAMNGLKPELKTIVMTKEPINVEELRHCATLTEKAIS
jgi:hypothetical protein